jgi:hypothetical protein
MEEEILEITPEKTENQILAPITTSTGTGLPDLETVARRADYIKKVFAKACLALSPKNIVDFGGQPYLDNIACKKIANLFDLQVQQFHSNIGVAYQKEMIDSATNHYIIRIAGKVFFKSNPSDYEVYEGTADSFGDWFRQWQITEEREENGKKKTVVVSAQTLPQQKVEEKATANLLQRAVKKKLGLDFTWEELEQAGVDRNKCKGFSFKSSGVADSAETVAKKQEVWTKIVEICNGNVDLAKKTLMKHTAFNDFAGHSDINKVSEKQLTFLEKKVNTAYEDYLKKLEKGE